MKRKTAALYDPYLDVMGGGERHILSILQVLEQEGYDVTIFWDKDVSRDIRDRLHLHFKNLDFKPNIFSFPSPYKKIRHLFQFDMFFYVTDGSYFFSPATRNYVFCMVPDKSLYRMNFMNRTKTFNYNFIANSAYTKEWLHRWKINAQVIYPYIDRDFIETDLSHTKKGRTILAVGRFFPHLHAKKHEDIVNAFIYFSKKHKDYQLVMAGGVKKEDMDYFENLEDFVKENRNIILRPNISYRDLLELYRNSEYFWHFTGFGINEEEHPEQVEHLGITPLEAMASGAVPLCYRAGGLKEIIREGQNGYLFLTQSELLEKMERLITSPDLYRSMQRAAQETVREKFSFDVFKQRIQNVLIK